MISTQVKSCNPREVASATSRLFVLYKDSYIQKFSLIYYLYE
nr:MAG TPA: hypothetical protein [Caudoviricetes sp.]